MEVAVHEGDAIARHLSPCLHHRIEARVQELCHGDERHGQVLPKPRPGRRKCRGEGDLRLCHEDRIRGAARIPEEFQLTESRVVPPLRVKGGKVADRHLDVLDRSPEAIGHTCIAHVFEQEHEHTRRGIDVGVEAMRRRDTRIGPEMAVELDLPCIAAHRLHQPADGFVRRGELRDERTGCTCLDAVILQPKPGDHGRRALRLRRSPSGARSRARPVGRRTRVTSSQAIGRSVGRDQPEWRCS